MHGNRACMAAENMDVGARHNKMLAGPGGQKAPSNMGKLSTPEVLRLRATSAVSPDKSVRRSAQDDVFAGVYKKHIENKLALMRR